MNQRVREAAGLFGPASVSWRIDREVIVLAGGSCALLMQAAHPAVAAGVAQHSTYRADPYGRLLRTLNSSFAVVFGSRRQAMRAIARVNAIHRAVRGTIPETGTGYSALDPEALLWVHATLVDTALRIYSRFVEQLSPDEAESYHAECAPIAELLGVPSERLPPTLAELRAWMSGMVASDAVRVTPTAREVAHTILHPRRFPPPFVWDLAHMISISALPQPIRTGYGISWSASRERSVERLASVTRRSLRFLPPALRYVPHARSAEGRIRRAVAGQGEALAGRYDAEARSHAPMPPVPVASAAEEPG